MSNKITRKRFLQQAGSVAALSAIGFPNILIPKRKDKLGVALVGLGGYSRGRLGPGLEKTEHCELKGIVTGTPSKIPEWQEKYGISDRNVYNYENMHEVANNDEIDIIYVVTPPGLHAEHSIIGAEAGKHVWCEKPMAMDVEECQAIIDATERNNVQLTIGLRMLHEPNTQEIIRFGKEETYGAVTGVASGAGFRGSFSDPDNWRRRPELGGGALYDMGVYPINAARHATGMEPVAVRGRQWSDREEMYSDVDEHSEFEMEFPGGVMAKCETSFGNSTNYLDIDAADGWYRLRPFQSYSGVRGETSSGRELPADPDHQQARQMDNDAWAIKENLDPKAPGEDGLEDIRIVRAIMESAQNGGDWVEVER
ncbi:MAG: Gfo/Idh/MocA family oxidoreductase [Balneolaceae bacterium]|nr:Gfo/Idh/MocA family oxidoreductase [Balneolaceae bacterium]